MRLEQTEEGVVVERYPYEDTSIDHRVEGAYDEGMIDGICMTLFVLFLLTLIGVMLNILLFG